MKELSLNVLDIAKNSVRAGAKNIGIYINEDSDGILTLKIKDDGCGMEQEQVDQLLYQMKRQSLHRSSQKDSIGLANICHRLGLFYGDKADFTIESRPGEGTRVLIRIPRETEERMEECTK